MWGSLGVSLARSWTFQELRWSPHGPLLGLALSILEAFSGQELKKKNVSNLIDDSMLDFDRSRVDFGFHFDAVFASERASALEPWVRTWASSDMYSALRGVSALATQHSCVKRSAWSRKRRRAASPPTLSVPTTTASGGSLGRVICFTPRWSARLRRKLTLRWKVF